eukprot:8540278-Pyramimonas_sp.AAC.1
MARGRHASGGRGGQAVRSVGFSPLARKTRIISRMEGDMSRARWSKRWQYRSCRMAIGIGDFQQ